MDKEYENTCTVIQSPVKTERINGSGFFSCSHDGFLLSLTLDNDALNKDTINRQLSDQLYNASMIRKEAKAEDFGGGRIIIKSGQVYVLWMQEGRANELFDMDFD